MKTKGKACEGDRALLIVNQRYLQTQAGLDRGVAGARGNGQTIWVNYICHAG